MVTNDKQSFNPHSQKTMLHTVITANLAILPLSLAVIPWGILCGTLSIEAGLTNIQAQLMSLLIFAGAAQLAGIAILGAAGSWLSLLNSTAMISVRHVLYSATYQDHVRHLPIYKRLLFAFLLTDEMFVVAQAEQLKTGQFDYWYAVIAGFGFYAAWNIATFIGIYTAHLLGDIEQMGFDFAIAAIFIAMVVPMLFKTVSTNQTINACDTATVTKSTEPKTAIPPISKKTIYLPMLAAVIVSALTALIWAYFDLPQGLIVSTLFGMATGALLMQYSKQQNLKTGI